jgi:hypothetical protein
MKPGRPIPEPRQLKWIGGGLLLAVLLGVGGWQGYEYWQRQQAIAAAESDVGPDMDAATRTGGAEIVTVDEPTRTDPNLGATPMAERVAVVGLLNKRNGQARDLTLKPGQATRVGDTIVRLRACETTAPYEQEQLTGAFVQVDVRQLDDSWRRVFSGWLYKERPSLNVVLHPVYDVWVKSCAMTFPDSGPAPDAEPTPAAPRRSRASNDPGPAAPAAAAPAPAATVPPPPPPSPSAADNN